MGCLGVDVVCEGDLDDEGLYFFGVLVLVVVLGVFGLDCFGDQCEGLEGEIDYDEVVCDVFEYF